MLKYHQEANENGQGEEMKCHMQWMNRKLLSLMFAKRVEGVMNVLFHLWFISDMVHQSGNMKKKCINIYSNGKTKLRFLYNTMNTADEYKLRRQSTVDLIQFNK